MKSGATTISTREYTASDVGVGVSVGAAAAASNDATDLSGHLTICMCAKCPKPSFVWTSSTPSTILYWVQSVRRWHQVN